MSVRWSPIVQALRAAEAAAGDGASSGKPAGTPKPRKAARSPKKRARR